MAYQRYTNRPTRSRTSRHNNEPWDLDDQAPNYSSKHTRYAASPEYSSPGHSLEESDSSSEYISRPRYSKSDYISRPSRGKSRKERDVRGEVDYAAQQVIHAGRDREYQSSRLPYPETQDWAVDVYTTYPPTSTMIPDPRHPSSQMYAQTSSFTAPISHTRTHHTSIPLASPYISGSRSDRYPRSQQTQHVGTEEEAWTIDAYASMHDMLHALQGAGSTSGPTSVPNPTSTIKPARSRRREIAYEEETYTDLSSETDLESEGIGDDTGSDSDIQTIPRPKKIENGTGHGYSRHEHSHKGKARKIRTKDRGVWFSDDCEAEEEDEDEDEDVEIRYTSETDSHSEIDTDSATDNENDSDIQTLPVPPLPPSPPRPRSRLHHKHHRQQQLTHPRAHHQSPHKHKQPHQSTHALSQPSYPAHNFSFSSPTLSPPPALRSHQYGHHEPHGGRRHRFDTSRFTSSDTEGSESEGGSDVAFVYSEDEEESGNEYDRGSDVDVYADRNYGRRYTSVSKRR